MVTGKVPETVNLARILELQQETGLQEASRKSPSWNVAVFSRILDKGHVGPTEVPLSLDTVNFDTADA